VSGLLQHFFDQTFLYIPFGCSQGIPFSSAEIYVLNIFADANETFSQGTVVNEAQAVFQKRKRKKEKKIQKSFS
jgi:hypothetical protein